MTAFADIPAPPVPAYQNVGEFGALWEYVAARRHARVLEIGSLFGGTLWYWAHLPNLRHVVVVDVPSDHPTVAAGVREARPLWAGWMPERVKFTDVAADSQSVASYDRVCEALDGERFDFAFIDGDHTYNGIRADWEAWQHLMRPGGVVAFHDTWPNPDGRHEPGVVRFVDELRAQVPSVEWTDPDGVGITAFTIP